MSACLPKLGGYYLRHNDLFNGKIVYLVIPPLPIATPSLFFVIAPAHQIVLETIPPLYPKLGDNDNNSGKATPCSNSKFLGSRPSSGFAAPGAHPSVANVYNG